MAAKKKSSRKRKCIMVKIKGRQQRMCPKGKRMVFAKNKR